jgi:hypothetical protein
MTPGIALIGSGKEDVMMRVVAGLICAAIFSGAAAAQIFPDLEITEIQRRMQSPAETPPDPGPAPADPRPQPDPSEQVNAYERFQEVLAEYQSNLDAIRRESSEYTRDIHVSVRAYVEGMYLLRMGRYTEAERVLSRVGHSVSREREVTDEAGLALIAEIKAGKAYYYGAIALTMTFWDNFRTESDLQRAWSNALARAQRSHLSTFETQAGRGNLADYDEVERLIVSFRLNGESNWRTRWQAEQRVREHHQNAESWQSLVQATGSGDSLTRQVTTPDHIRQRAALRVLVELFQESAYVASGLADIALGYNHIAIGQIKDYRAHFQPKPYHRPAAADRLAQAASAADRLVTAIEGLKG